MMLSLVLLTLLAPSPYQAADVLTAPLPPSAPASAPGSAFQSGRYRNLFRELGKSDTEIAAKVNRAWRQLFYGDDKNERIYFPTGKDMDYIKDVGSNDVRTEGMSYGMMIAVQFDRREEFDRLWRWADQVMRFKDGPNKGFFAWNCATDGSNRAGSPASDGEEYFAMSLYFAAARWGTKGEIDYRKEADSILDAMLHRPTNDPASSPMFDLKQKQVVFVPGGSAATFTDPSYHLPAFYELWARWAPKDQSFWKEAAQTSRNYFRKACHPTTGLAPDLTQFDGTPTRLPWDPKNTGDRFQSDALRVAGNIAMDWAWFAKDPWQVEQSNRMLGFLASQKPDYVSMYTIDGKPVVTYRATGHVAMNAVATLAAHRPDNRRFVQDLWDAEIPTGQWRYYDGVLYMFGLLHASGQYRIWKLK